ncbi:hypothetical protein BX600DRAFT_429011 [Xylariales sp. PMI_506]|nr:hypothetical protein BX600DRAFT_429011 [Xylariales sp. PMI_506]
MLTNITSQSMPRAAPLQLRVAGTRVLAPVGSSMLKLHHCHQIRAYRHGMWSSYIDPEFHRDIRRRHRSLKYKYVETLSQRLSWKHPVQEASKVALRHVALSYWYPGSSNCGSRFVSTNESANHARRRTHARAQQSAQEERRVYSTITSFGHDTGTYPKVQAVEEEYVIDPITNRKVVRKTYGSPDDADAPTDTFKSYRSQFTTFASSDNEATDTMQPIFSDGPPPVDELRKYKQGPEAQVQSEEYALNHLPPEDGAEEQYEDLHKYEALKHDEISISSESATEAYEDLSEYKPYMHNEEATSKSDSPEVYEDLHKYTPYLHGEDVANEQADHQYNDLHKYGAYRYEEDVRADEAHPKYDDLHQYKSTHLTDEIKNDPTPPGQDLKQYQPYLYDEEKLGRAVAEPTSEYDDLHKYENVELSEPISGKEDGPFEQYGDLDKYKAFIVKELEDKAALEYDAATESLNPDTGESGARKALERSMYDHIVASDAADREASASVKRVRTATQTGTLEDTATQGIPRVADEDVVQSRAQGEEKEYSELRSQAANASRLGSALDRTSKSNNRPLSDEQRMQAYADPYSKNPQGLETSYARESSSEPPFVKMYGTLEERLEDHVRETVIEQASPVSLESLVEEIAPSRSETVPTALSTVYKILAYDEATQDVNIVETSSVVPDPAVALTPAEALLRLSHPTKFLPHFAPLQAEGFEIVSGNDHILIFRKVRDPPAKPPGGRPAVNPIDMMGRSTALPNAAAFASPTGFVNYEVPEVEQVQSPTFRSNIDVRREEPVFSGAKPASAEAPRPAKRGSVTKRVLIGGAWVAGVSYALGVVSEFFITGGLDGKGPTGF